MSVNQSPFQGWKLKLAASYSNNPSAEGASWIERYSNGTPTDEATEGPQDLHPNLAPGERPELLPQPSDATKHWYYYGCLACDEIRVNKLVVASLCTPEELAQEPYKSTNSKNNCTECEESVGYHREIEEDTDHAVRLAKGGCGTGSDTSRARRSQEQAVCEVPRSHGMLTSLLQEHVRFLGEKLVELAGDSGEEGVHDEECETSTSFSILST
ncbi:hypothetical protein B0H14DRAFT_2623842 [Mycena olivaceomarginata]|nr:hypothetical protein B0H14DRAFT_2623842 [Mycena olivaceomarginata]